MVSLARPRSVQGRKRAGSGAAIGRIPGARCLVRPLPSKESYRVTRSDVNRVRAAGYSDAQSLETVTVVG